MKKNNSFLLVAFFYGFLWFPNLGYSQKFNLTLGDFFAQRGNYSKAIEQYQKALPKLEKDSMLNVYLTLFHLHQKQHEIDKNTSLHLRKCIRISKKIEQYSTNDFYPDSINQLTTNWAKQVLFEKALKRSQYNYAFEYIQNLPNLTLTDSVLLASYQFGLSQSSEDLTRFLAVVTRYDQQNLNNESTNELINSLTIKDVYVYKQLDSAFINSFKHTASFEKRVAPLINSIIDSLYNQLDSIFFNLRDEWENIKFLHYLGEKFVDEDKIKVIYQDTPSANLADYLPKDTATRIHVNQTIEYNIRFQTEFYKQINAYRKANGKKPLQPDSVLEASALQHSKYQAYEDTMTHYETNTSNPYYTGETVYVRNGDGENIVYGAGGTDAELSALFAFAIWKSSPGHDWNMLYDYKFVGVAVYDGYCTTVFGI